MAAIDISFTVLERVRQGRRLMRNLDTGQIYWEPAEAPAVAEADTPAAPVPTPTPTKKPRRRKSSEGDK